MLYIISWNILDMRAPLAGGLRVWNGIIDAFGRDAIGPLLGARRKDMPGIFDDA